MHSRILEKELLKSQVLRVSILLGLFVCVLFYTMLWQIFSPEGYHKIYSHANQVNKPVLIIFLLLIYSGLVLSILKFFQRKSITIPQGFILLLVCIETSIPSVFLYNLSQLHSPIHVLSSAMPFLYIFFIILSALFLNVWVCILSGIIATAEYLFIAHLLIDPSVLAHETSIVFSEQQLIARGFSFFIAALAVAFVTYKTKSSLVSAFKSEMEREHIAHVFGRHVSPAVVNMLLSQGSHQGTQSKFVCVLFLDIRNFTSYAESKKPEEVVRYLNDLFGFMIEIINNNHGIINKFLGDGFMAVFGAPISQGGDVDNAVRAAEQILSKIEEEIAEKRIDKTRVGIGLHCGEVVTGNIGDNQRQEYTIIGDVVNLASRLQDLNKEYSSELIISEDVYENLSEPRGELLGDASVRGRSTLIKIYKLK